MSTSIYYVIICAAAMGFWNVLVSNASKEMHPLLGAVICELTALVVGAVVLLPVFKAGTVQFSFRSVVLVMLAGLCVLSADYFALRAYNQGMPVSIGGPIIIGGSIVLVSVAGFIMGDKMSFLKLISILMIIAGASTLAGLSR